MGAVQEYTVLITAIMNNDDPPYPGRANIRMVTILMQPIKLLNLLSIHYGYWTLRSTRFCSVQICAVHSGHLIPRCKHFYTVEDSRPANSAGVVAHLCSHFISRTTRPRASATAVGVVAYFWFYQLNETKEQH